MSAALCLAPGAPTPARFALPRGACDCHAHVLGPFDRYPLASVRPYDPPEVGIERLRTMMATMGLERIVIAHVSAHGMDMAVTLDAMAAFGDRARGVAMLRPSVTDAELQALHRAGMRGVRLSKAYGSETPLDEHHVQLWADRIAPFGWHLSMWPGSLDELRMLERLAPRLPVEIALDHLASHAWFVGGQAQGEGVAVLDALLATNKAWLKLSGMYRATTAASPWQPLVATIAALAHRHLGRMLWASDWPFVGVSDPAILPRSGDLLDWLAVLGLGEREREDVLVRNPERLYGFTAL